MLPGGQNDRSPVTGILHSGSSPKPNPGHTVTGRPLPSSLRPARPEVWAFRSLFSRSPRSSRLTSRGIPGGGALPMAPAVSFPQGEGCDSAHFLLSQGSPPPPLRPCCRQHRARGMNLLLPDCCVTLGQPLSLSGPQRLDKKAPQPPVALTSMTTRRKGERGAGCPPWLGLLGLEVVRAELFWNPGGWGAGLPAGDSSFRLPQGAPCSDHRISEQPAPQTHAIIARAHRLARQDGSLGVTPAVRTAVAAWEAGVWHRHARREGAEPMLGPQTSPAASVRHQE